MSGPGVEWDAPADVDTTPDVTGDWRDGLDRVQREMVARVTDKLDDLDALAVSFESDPEAAEALRRHVRELRSLLMLAP